MTEKILSQGAEAVISLKDNLVIKNRISKSYRIKELDEKIRKRRTKAEKNLLEKACRIINAPNPLPLKEFNVIEMPYIRGKRLSDCLDSFPLQKQKEICEKIGENISKLHNENIIHGDLTPGNMILAESDRIDDDKTDNINKKDKSFDINDIDKQISKRDDNTFKIFFIDFGLGFISAKIEDKAVDLHLLREALEAGFAKNQEALFDSVKKGYSKDYKDSKLVLERFKAVERRGRYRN